MKQDILNTVDDKIKTANKSPSNLDITNGMDKVIDERLEERNEQERRKNNVIMVNVPEVNENIPDADKHNKDKEQVISLLGKANHIKEEDIEELVRLGKRGQYPRVIKVAFKSKDTKHKVITSQKKLNNGTKDTKKVIHINHDYTSSQRQLEARLREEIKQRREKGEQNRIMVAPDCLVALMILVLLKVIKLIIIIL